MADVPLQGIGDVPLVDVEEAGGPYDTVAYMAGYRIGYAQALMRVAAADALVMLVARVDRRQLDLVAMATGWVIAEVGCSCGLPESEHPMFTRVTPL